MSQRSLEVIILAAGKGSRMNSSLPKVMHPLAGLPMLMHVLNAANKLSPKVIHIVYGYGGAELQNYLSENSLNGAPINWVEQTQLLGTGDALMRVQPHLLQPESMVLVLYGDVPLITEKTLIALHDCALETGFALLTEQAVNPSGYGRIIRSANGAVSGIVEDKDANEQQVAIKEVNTGIMLFSAEKLEAWLSSLSNNNAQKEYYLTDLVSLAVKDGIEISTLNPFNEDEAMGVNNRIELASLERILQKKQAKILMESGVTLLDPDRIDIRGNVEISRDVVIDVGVILEGEVTIGEGAHIGAYTLIKNSTIEANATINAHCVIEDAHIGMACNVGPFARLRPGTRLQDSSRIGNFVEVKNSCVGLESKVNHLSYIGDAALGDQVNIGAGTITCNYDGANKHQTIIEDNVFVGSCSQLVAPVVIGEGATIGAGSTITKDVAVGDLALSRSPQKTKKGWKRPKKGS